MLRRSLFILTLALLFGLGQEGAAIHAISHIADRQTEQHDKAPHTQQTCEQCVVYAKLGNAVGSTALTLPLATTSPPSPTFSHQSTASVTPRHYQARGPPQFS